MFSIPKEKSLEETRASRISLSHSASEPASAFCRRTNCLMRDGRGKWPAEAADWSFHPHPRTSVLSQGHLEQFSVTPDVCNKQRNWRTYKLHTQSSQALEPKPGRQNIETAEVWQYWVFVNMWSFFVLMYANFLVLFLFNAVNLPILTSSEPFFFFFLFVYTSAMGSR